MTSQIDPIRFFDGWDKRLSLGRTVLDGAEPLTTQSEADESVSRAALLAQGIGQTSLIPTYLHVARVVLSFKTVNEQLNFISQFDNSITKLTAPLTVGSIFSNPKSDLAKISNEDYSLVCLSEFFLSAVHSDIEGVSRSIDRFLGSLNAPEVDGLTTFNAFAEAFGLRPLPASGLRAVSAIAFQLKQLRWAIMGADTLSLIQALCDPLHVLTLDQIQTGHQLATIWKLDQLVLKLILIRAFGGYEVEKKFCIERQHYFGELNRGVMRIANFVFSEEPRDGIESAAFLKNLAQGDIVSQLLATSANIALATKRRSLSVLKQQLLVLFNSDSAAPYFLNWLSIHESFPLPASEADLSSIFLKSIMSSTIVGRRFFTVALARGKGQLVADLSSYVARLRGVRDTHNDQSTRPANRQRAKGTYDFVRGMRTLPINVRNQLMEDVLEKGMMERLAFAFPASIALPDPGLSRSDNQASLLRIELANLAKRETVLNEKRAFRIIEEETQYLRMLQFHTFFKAGRVKVDWDYLTLIVANSIERRFDLILSGDSETATHTPVFRNVVELISQEISDILLFDSEASLDQALSNNLRHGVIVPRFLRAINDSLTSTSDGASPLADFNDAASSRFGKSAKHILSLRETIVLTINNFKDTWLTIERGGRFNIEIKELVSTHLLEAASQQPATAPWSLGEKIVEQFQTRVERVIEEMLSAFKDEVQPRIHDAIMLAHRECNKAPSSRTTSFLDSLETNVRAGYDEVVGWLGLSKFAMNVEDFDIMELIRFESSSFILSDFRKLNVKYFSFEKRDAKILRKNEAHRFKGAFFEAIQEIIHNLISNAFKYSGLKVNTEVVFSVIVDGDDLIFRCENNFAESNLEKILVERINGLRIIKQERPDQAQEDTLSGFHKIKNVCSRVFGQDVVINIPPVSARQKKFMIEITVEDVALDALV